MISPTYVFAPQVSQLKSEQHVIRHKAVVAARELLTGTKHIQCLTAGITPALIEALKVREASAHGTV